jgi:tetratricopeptide (TPR) repeat protein
MKDSNAAEFITLHRVLAALSFLIILVIYTLTVQPSVPFWDCGEFLGMMTWQQVPHPPGAPLFSILGGVVQVLIPFGEMGWQGNMISVVASAITVMLLYLMIVIVIKNLRTATIDNLTDALAVYGSAFVGSIAFGFSATFWFNGVESEVYATGILNVAIVLYLMMRWTQVADEKGNERYLLLSVYITGLSMGVHLLSMLVLFTIILIVYFRKYNVTLKTFLWMAALGLLAYEVVIVLIGQSLPAFLAGHSTGRTEAMEFAIENSGALTSFTVLCILGICALFVWGYKKKKAVPALISLSLLMVIFSFTVFAHVLIRSHANPPMNENSTKTMANLASYIGREQYGEAPMWPRRYQTEDYFIQNYNKQDDNGQYVYGPWTPPGRKPVTRKDGSQIAANDWSNADNGAELTYMVKYQANHMYWRYFFWNFVGRMSDTQDEGVAWFNTKSDEKRANYKTGNLGLYPIKYFALPFLFGLIGLFFQFKKDPYYALTFLATFLVFGILTALFQNQQEPQPRERDYFYVGSFIIWGLWMALGTYGIIDSIRKKNMKATPLVSLILIISFLLVPFNMLYSNYPVYGRDGKYLPFDYAYNVLQSLEQDAILFTNGDNDTFPVWFIQDVEGVRRDVRVCNLSLGQTLWYIDQLKNREPWGAKKVPISISNDSLHVDDEYSVGAFSYDIGPAKTDVISVPKDILAKFTDDQNIINSGKVSMTFLGRQYQQDNKGVMNYIHRVNDKLVRNIIITNKFERPVYYISTAGSEAMCGLEGYMRIEGLAKRICPTPQRTVGGNDAYNEEVMDKILLNVDNSSNFSKIPKYGLKLRNLNSPSVSYDETDRRTVLMTYPNMFIGYAAYLATVKQDFSKAQKIMDIYTKYIPLEKFPLAIDQEYKIANIYDLCGNKEKAMKYAKMGITSSEEQIADRNLDRRAAEMEFIGRYYGPYQIAAELYKMTNQWDKAQQRLEQIAAIMDGYLSQLSKEDADRLYARMSSIKLSAREIAVDKLEAEGNLQEAINESKKIEEELARSSEPYAQYFMSSITQRKNEMETKLGIPMTLAPSMMPAPVLSDTSVNTNP